MNFLHISILSCQFNQGIVFYPMVFPQYGPSQIFLYYFGIEKTFGHNIAIIWFNFEFLIMNFLHIPMPWRNSCHNGYIHSGDSNRSVIGRFFQAIWKVASILSPHFGHGSPISLFNSILQVSQKSLCITPLCK